MEEARYQWALLYNPDPTPDRPAFDWTTVCFTDETAGKVGLISGRWTAWRLVEECYHEDVKHVKVTNYTEVHFWAFFVYGAKGPCHVHFKETSKEAQEAAKELQSCNKVRQSKYNTRSKLVSQVRHALHEMNEPALNAVGRRLPYNQVKRLDTEKPLKRGDRQRGGIDGYRHEQLVL